MPRKDGFTKDAQFSEKLHRITHVEDVLDASASTVRRLIKDDVLESRYIRGSLRVTDSSLLALLSAGTRRNAPAQDA
jgi:hypothetical protein